MIRYSGYDPQSGACHLRRPISEPHPGDAPEEDGVQDYLQDRRCAIEVLLVLVRDEHHRLSAEWAGARQHAGQIMRLPLQPLLQALLVHERPMAAAGQLPDELVFTVIVMTDNTCVH